MKCETGYVRQETWERRQDTRDMNKETGNNGALLLWCKDFKGGAHCDGTN